MNQSSVCIFVNFLLIVFYCFALYNNSFYKRRETWSTSNTETSEALTNTHKTSKSVFNNHSSDRNATVTETFAEIQHQRQEKIINFCKRDLEKQSSSKTRISNPGKFVSFFLSHGKESSSSHWLLWCPVLKAASSNWFYRLRKSLKAFHLEIQFRFAVMAGASPPQLAEKGRDRLVMRLTGSKSRGRDMIERMFDMEDTISWLVVRNPLSRIVSAYR